MLSLQRYHGAVWNKNLTRTNHFTETSQLNGTLQDEESLVPPYPWVPLV